MNSSCIPFVFSSLILFLITTTISASSVSGNKTDHEALLHFKSMITNDPHEALSSWNDSLHFCDWNGVSCGKRHRRVTILRLYSQGLEGSLSPYVGNLSFLRYFSLRNNIFQGTIPHELSRLSRVRILQLGINKFHGVIPTNLSGCLNIEVIGLSFNNLVGSIPKELSFLTKLTNLLVGSNKLTGGIPSVLGNITSMESFSGAENPFGGSIPDTLGNWKSLREFGCGDCNLNGTIPHSIYNLSLLTVFSLPLNQLTASISNIGNLVGLENLDLAVNRFTGKLPYNIGKLQRLQFASLSANQFSGPIPDAIGNLSLLTKLWLSSNRLEGHIPSSIGNCHSLIDLRLYDNKLSGRIPKQLVQLSNLSIELDLSQNNLSGSLPTEVGNLKMLTSLDLSDNNLSGKIPSSLGDCTNLVFLSLRGNLFQGMVPSSLTSMRAVSTLDLSHNNLSGKIPQFSKRFSFENVNLSFNDFEDEVPMIGVFSNASLFSVLGNNRLCGGLVQLRLPKCKETKKHRKKFPLFAIVILITSSTLIATLCLVYAWRKKIKGQPTQSPADGRFLKVSYNQLLKATNGFSEDNLIGEGGFASVYKGILHDHDDTVVALKVLHLQNRGALKSFMAECEAWRSIRHRNLLKIITSCSSVDFQGNDFKALVYEFMPNGSLHDWLHSSANTSRLNLIQRIRILIDVASALDYLHNQCLPSIIHCDLKPSNILLDDEMVAHVGDFGLARFFGTNSNQNSTSGIRGTIGYAPPEYGIGSEMTSSGDVYSFGILLLELMTRKRPTDEIFNEGLNLHKFADMALADSVIDVIDDDLLNFLQEDAIATRCTIENAKKIEECLASTLKIGVSCSMESPPQRMNIANVIQELQHTLATLREMRGDM